MGHSSSRILLPFPHVENSCEINPSHMVFMTFNFAKSGGALYLAYHEVCSMRENAFCMVFHARSISHHSSPNPTYVTSDSMGFGDSILHGKPYKMLIVSLSLQPMAEGDPLPCLKNSTLGVRPHYRPLHVPKFISNKITDGQDQFFL